MKQIIAHTILIMLCVMPVWASYSAPPLTEEVLGPVDSSPDTIFQQHIPIIAEQFIGIPFKMGGKPERSGTTDNSSLFYTIYTTAAQKAGMRYNAYLPMRNLLKNTQPVNDWDIRNGDLIVLTNTLAAMVYRVDPSGRMHFIYASKKRQQVIAFHSDNLVYQAYWLEHLRGFFRLNQDMLSSGF